MRFLNKIKWRLQIYEDLFRQRNRIKTLYFSLDEDGKKVLFSTIKDRLTLPLKPHFYLKKIAPREYSNFYCPERNSFVFENYSFRSIHLLHNPHKESFLIQQISFIIREIFIDRVYEEGEVKIEPEDVILDCGAHIGIFSIYAAKKGLMVYSFEPAEENVVSLNLNKELNQCDNIKVISKAVWDTVKNLNFTLGEHSGDGYVNKQGDEDRDKKKIEVEAISIDDFVRKENLTKVDFIKMDIEGSEARALLGAKKTLKKFKPKLAICIYHKLSDFYEIPLLIKRLNPEYKIRVKNKKGTLIAYAF